MFYHKVRGNYYRDIVEITDADKKLIVFGSARKAYDDAIQVVVQDLPVTHPIRFFSTWNFSVVHCEILGNPDEAVADGGEALSRRPSGADAAALTSLGAIPLSVCDILQKPSPLRGSLS